jgi:Glycosyltransferase family 87
VVAVALTGYFALLEILGGCTSWHLLGVPQLSPPFADLRFITSAWQCINEHVPVHSLNPCDPLNRRVDYPAIWFFPAALGLGENSTTSLGILLALAFLLSAVAVVPRDTGEREAFIYSLAVCSPAVMLGVERGNTDLIVFVLLVAAAASLSHRHDSLILGAGALLLAAVLKLFPILTLPALARRNRRTACAGAIVVGGFAAYAVAARDDLSKVARAVPVRIGDSYGMDLPKLASHSAVMALVAVALAAIAIALAALLRRYVDWPNTTEVTDRLRLFWMGSSVYLGTFVLTRSFDYRMVFLLLAIPQLLEWSRERSVFARGTLVAIVAGMWLMKATLVATALQTIVFASLLAAVLVSAPRGRGLDDKPLAEPAAGED